MMEKYYRYMSVLSSEYKPAYEVSVYKWCQQQFEDSRWHCFYNREGFLTYFFKEKEDKLLFDLTWM